MEVYVLVRRKNSFLDNFLPYLMISLDVLCFLLAFITPIALLFALLFMALWYVFQGRACTEYEYSYFDGEVRFAKIISMRKRKSLGEIDMAAVEKIAPAGHDSVAHYEKDSRVKIKDYTSRKSGVPYYELVARYDGNVTLFKLELDDKFISEVSKKYASKVVRRQ